MNRYFTLVGFLLTSIGLSTAQTNTYDLSAYETADYKRKELNFEFNASGDFKNVKLENNYTRNTANGNLKGEYFSIKNTRRLQEEIRLKIGLTNDYSHYKDNESEDFPNYFVKEQGFGTSVLLSRIGRRYLTKTFYLEVSPSAQLNYKRNTYKSDQIDKRKETDFSSTVGANIGVGVGRIEQVEDARQAVYILDDLRKKNVLNRDMTHDEITEFASLITKIKNKRQFDSRIKLIEEITAVDSLLESKGIVIKDAGAAFYTSLYDMWMYGGLERRQAGNRFSIGVTPQYYFSRYSKDQPYRDKDITSTVSGIAYVKYEYENPVNLKLQKSASLYGGFGWGKPRDAHNVILTEFVGSYGLGYYINTRTYFSLNAVEEFGWSRFGGADDRANYLRTITSLVGKGYYYLSPQFRIFGDCGLSYEFTRDIDNNLNYHDKSPHVRFNFGIQYSFF